MEEEALNVGLKKKNVQIWITKKEKLNIPFGGSALVRIKAM